MKEKIILDLVRFVLISIIVSSIVYFAYPLIRYSYFYDLENTGSFDSASREERMYRIDRFNQEVQMYVLRGENRGNWMTIKN